MKETSNIKFNVIFDKIKNFNLMKKILLSLIILSIISCAEKEIPVNYAIFSGKIENSSGPTLSVRNSEKAVKDFAVQSDGTFIDTIRNIDSGYYTFKYNNETSVFYLKPGDNINLTIDTKEFDETIKYTGIGSNENNYLAQKYLNDENLGKLVTYKYLGTLDENAFVKITDSINQLETAYLNEQKDMDPDFKTLEEASIKYSKVNKLSKYELYRRYYTEEKEFEVSDSYPNYNKGLNLQDESLIEVTSYIAYLNSHYGKMAGKMVKKDSIDQALAMIKTISNEVTSTKIKDKLLYGAARYGVSYTKDLQNYYDIFMANSTVEDHKNDVTEKYKKLIKLAKGQPSPKFNDYENFKGGTTSLDDLKGQYVYVDVWATWCGPCKREIPYLKEVEKSYHGKNIAFVSMSIDVKNDHGKWLNMVEEKELGGIQLFADSDWKSQFVTDYAIQGIPRFILIDPNGNIVDSNAPRPSDSKLTDLFDELEI